MAQKRFDNGSGNEQGEGVLLGVEATRSASESAALSTPPKKDEEQISVFWRVFGGTILSMIALGTITLYNSISSNIAELRANLGQEREARAEMVKKDEFNTRTTSQYERIRSFEGLKAEFEGFKERVNANATAVAGLKKDTLVTVDACRRDIDAAKKDAAAVEVLKEKMATAAETLKAVREDVGRIQQEQERNKAADLERKVSRDTQHRSVEESLRELQKGLQDCRERLARLEGQRGPATPAETVPGRPVVPAETKGAAADQGAGVIKPGSGENPASSKPAPVEKPDGM